MKQITLRLIIVTFLGLTTNTCIFVKAQESSEEQEGESGDTPIMMSEICNLPLLPFKIICIVKLNTYVFDRLKTS